MKKTNLVKTVVAALWGALVASALLISCSKAAVNENGVYTDCREAAKAAKKNNEPVVVIATMDGADFYSTDFIQVVLNDSRFKDEIASDYTVLHLDFSQAAYEATVFNDDSTKEERKTAEAKAEVMQKNTLLASRLNLQMTPAIYILSPEMYFIAELDYLTDEVTNYDSFKALLEKQADAVQEMNEKIKATKSGTTVEKLAAIDSLYESTDMLYRAFLSDLIDEYISLDKKDESGLLSKYLLAKADIESSNYFMAGDVANAVKSYANVANDLRLAPEHRQNAYYLASYILAATNSMDFDLIKQYLTSAIDAYPEGPNVPQIQMILDQFEKMIAPLQQEQTADGAGADVE